MWNVHWVIIRVASGNHNLEVVTRVTSLPCQGFCSHDLVFVSLTPDPDLSFAVFFDCSSRSIVAHKNEPKSTLQVLSTLVVSCFVTQIGQLKAEHNYSTDSWLCTILV